MYAHLGDIAELSARMSKAEDRFEVVEDRLDTIEDTNVVKDEPEGETIDDIVL